MNIVLLVGRVGKDGATLREKGDKKFISFSLATTDRFKDKDGKTQERTEWHNVVSFRPGLVQLVTNDNLRQGSLVSIEGMLRTRTYQDKNDVKKYATSVVADSLSVLRFPPKVEKEAAKAEEKPAEEVPAGI